MYDIYIYAYMCICAYICIYNKNVIIVCYKYFIEKFPWNTIKLDRNVDCYNTVNIFNLLIPAQYSSSDPYFRWEHILCHYSISRNGIPRNLKLYNSKGKGAHFY